MDKLILYLRNIRGVLVKLLEYVVIIIMALLVLDVLWGVFTRYVLGEQSKWTEELARMLLIWVALLGASVAFAGKRHLGVDYFVGKLDPAAGKLIHVIVYLIVLFFAIAVFIVGGTYLTHEVFAMGQEMISLKIAKGWVYIVVPITGCFMVLFTCEQLVELLTGKEEVSE